MRCGDHGSHPGLPSDGAGHLLPVLSASIDSTKDWASRLREAKRNQFAGRKTERDYLTETRSGQRWSLPCESRSLGRAEGAEISRVLNNQYVRYGVASVSARLAFVFAFQEVVAQAAVRLAVGR